MNRSRTNLLFKKEKKQWLAMILVFVVFLLSPFFLLSQTVQKDSLLAEVTLQNAIGYAIEHQPQIQQSLIDQEILESNIKSRLSEWYPQINFNYIQQHNFLLPSSVIAGNLIKLGVDNSAAGQFTASQIIFNRDAMLANNTKKDIRLQAKQATSNNKIDLVADVSKAYYDVLATLQQIRVTETNIVRLQQSLKDAYNQYKAGVVDKIDYKRATISLNNSEANRRSGQEILKAKLQYLKSLMGYPQSASLNIMFDSLQMEKDMWIDTLQVADYTARIEYKMLSTQRKLLEYDLKYNKWSYLPNVWLNGAYNLNFQSNSFNQLYGSSFPASFAAINVGIPIFQGGKRKANIKAAELELQRNELDFADFKNSVNAGYTQALSIYKSNLLNFSALKENLNLAKEVYDVLQLQYRSGIKTYLEVIASETDLRESEISYYTALYQLLASKIDVQKQLGQINY